MNAAEALSHAPGYDLRECESSTSRARPGDGPAPRVVRLPGARRSRARWRNADLPATMDRYSFRREPLASALARGSRRNGLSPQEDVWLLPSRPPDLACRG